MKQNKQKTTKQAQMSFWQQEISFDLKKSPVLNFLKQDVDMDIKNSPVLNFLNKEIVTDLSQSPVLNFCKQEVTVGGFADVSASPILNWFKPVKTKTKNTKIGADEVVVKSLTKDIVISCLTVSVLMNMFMLISWLYYQVDPASRQAIIQMIFG